MPSAAFRSAALLSMGISLLVLAPAACAPAKATASASRDAANVPARPAANQHTLDAFIEQYASTNRFRMGLPAAIKVTPEGDAVLFLRSPPRSFVQDLYAFDIATGQERVLLTASSLLAGGEEQLTPEERARRERQRQSSRGIVSYSLSEDGRTLLVPLSGRLFLVDRATARTREVTSPAGYAIDPRLSPDGSKLACVRAGDLYVTDLTREPFTETRLTTATSPTVTNGLAEFVAQEEMDRSEGYWWSPDGQWLAYESADTAGMETFHIADPVHPEKDPEPWPYPRAGGRNTEVRLAIQSSRAPGTPVWVSWDYATFPYLARVDWSKGAPLTIVVQNRAQTDELLLSVDPASGQTIELLREHDDAWLNLAGDLPAWLDDASGFLWMTERGGAWQLELRAPDGSLVRTLTRPDFGLRGLAHLDSKSRAAYVTASPEPTEQHVWRVHLDGGAPTRLTDRPGVHSAVFADKSDAFVEINNPAEGDLTYTAHPVGSGAAHAIRAVAETPLLTPRVEWTHLGGEHDFRASIVRPASFRAGEARTYPVLVSVYGGPHSQTVLASRRAYLLPQWFAEHGFIVVSIDCRGTPSRGRAWERVTRNDLIRVPLEDQAAALRLLGARHPEMDLSRVGIYGWSFGGYFSAHAVMQKPDVFHAGVAGAPVADWRDYDTHYTERYMGMPDENAAGYDAASVLTHAKDLRRPLLIIHGTADDNVYFLHSLKMTEALFRAGKPFEFLPLAGFTHMVPDPSVTIHLQTRIAEFFARELRP